MGVGQLMRPVKLLPLAVLAAGAMGMATGAQAACVLNGKGATCRTGLSATTMLVTEEEWNAKWSSTHVGVMPFETTGKIKTGVKARVLIFFAPDRGGQLQLSCKTTINKSATYAGYIRPQICFKGEVTAGTVYRAWVTLSVEGKKPGTKELTIGVKNDTNGSSFALQTKVEFVP